MKLAVIPARGGSKRIPRKNIRPFAGKPIIAYSIQAALSSGCFDDVVVSTDDSEIAAIAESYGASVPFIRPVEIADDFTGTNAVVKHAIDWYCDQGHTVEHACCIYATAPFVTADVIRKGLALLTGGVDVQFAITVTGYSFPIQRALRILPEDRLGMFYPEYVMTRSQDLEETFHDAGQIYWGKAEAFVTNVPLFDHRSVPIYLPRKFVQDIDTPEDWELAEQLFMALNRQASQ